MPKQKQNVVIDGDIARIHLASGHIAIVDAADLPLLTAWRWRARVQSRSIYAVRHVAPKEQNSCAAMHRFIIHAPHGFDVDHIDGDGLNNRRANLRIATRSENCRNRRHFTKNEGSIKGVTFLPSRNKWRARIKIHGRIRHLGNFATQAEAAAAYAKASDDIHGAFGRIV